MHPQHQMIAAATQTLLQLLRRRMASPPGTLVSLPPDVKVKDPPGPRRVNLFLYRVAENPFLKNHDPGVPPGSYGRPPLSLDLHFLLTAYGSSDEDSKGALEVLGDAMAVLHDHPIIRPHDPAYADVRDPMLDEVAEHLRVALEPISVEDMSKVWTALTVPYRLSVAYVVNVVQVRTRVPRRPAPLVRSGTRDPRPLAGHEGAAPDELLALEGRRLQVVAHEPMALESVMVLRPGQPDDAAPGVAYAAVGDRLVLTGRNLGRPVAEGGLPTFVQAGAVRIPVPPATHTPTRIVAPVPDDARLQPGPLNVHVAAEPGGGRLQASNRRPALLIPYVESAWVTSAQVPDPERPAPPGQPQPQKTVPAVGIRGTRLHRPGAECSTLLTRPGGHALHLPGDSYILWQPQPPDAQEVIIPLPPGTAAAGMGVRVLVEGHENLPRPGLEVQP